jgi:hypothetical protein
LYVQDPDTHPLVNRARTGHTRTRAHLHHIGIKAEATCRHCHSTPETLEHLVLYCTNLPRPQPLLAARIQYAISLTRTPFSEWLWTAPLQDITHLLTTAARAGATI